MGQTTWEIHDDMNYRNKTAQAHHLADQVYGLCLDLKGFDVPERFTHSLEDLLNFLNVNWPKTK